MFSRKCINAVLILFFGFGTTAITAQDCPAPTLTPRTSTEIPFTPQQEADLGDVMAEQVEREYRVIDDPQINAYLKGIADRIAKNLPLDNVRLRVFAVDLPEANAYATAGGRIYVTRKLISMSRTEDDLASVIAHELGHAAIRHAALTYSRLFKEVIGVTQFGDRADISEKYNRLLENANTKIVKFPSNISAVEQREADRAGIFAFVAAGYDPAVYTSFWKRLTEAKKSSFFSQLFGTSSTADKRLGEMLATIKSLPAACLTRRGTAQPIGDFAKWRTYTVGYSRLDNTESLKALVSRQSLTPLRRDIERLAFSPDGAYILASDGPSVAVLRREPFAYLFRVEGDDGMRASFSPDSQTLSVVDKNLRVQRWDIATKSAISANEVTVREPWQTEMSPDGRFMAAYLKNGDLVLYDVATNEPLFTVKKFYVPGELESTILEVFSELFAAEDLQIFNFRFSPNGRHLLVGRNLYLPFGREKTVGVDLSSMAEISLPDDVKLAIMRGGSFIAPDRIVGQISNDATKSGVFAFPSGERLEQFTLGGLSFAGNGNYVVVRPVAGAPVGIFDRVQKRYVLGNKKSAFDVYGTSYVAERKTGEIGLYKIGTSEPVAVAEIPSGTLGGISTAAVSPDGRYLAASVRTRGAVWDLATGKRLMHVRGFNGSFFTADGKLLADFPEMDATERAIVRIDPATAKVEVGPSVPKGRMTQLGRYLIFQRGADELSVQPKNASGDLRNDRSELPRTNTVMEVRDVGSGEVLWSRKFVDERPSFTLSTLTRTMVLLWPVKSKAAAAIIKSDPALTARAAGLQDSAGDYLFEVIDPQTGVARSRFLFESGKGSIKVSAITATGDYLIVADEDNRVLLYSLSTGQLLRRFFGERAVVSTASGMIAIENFPGSVTIYDITTGAELERLVFSRPIAVMQFADERKQFFAVTEDQTAYSFDATQFGKKSGTP